MTLPAQSPPGLPIPDGTWSLDPARTSVTLRTRALWLVPVTGTVRAASGGGSSAADGTLTGTLVLDAASVSTGNRKRDEHLRTADFLDTVAHPVITFTASGARPAGPGLLHIDGSLTVRGVTRPLTVTARVAVAGNSATVRAETDIDRSHWGISRTAMGARLATHVTIDASFTQT